MKQALEDTAEGAKFEMSELKEAKEKEVHDLREFKELWEVGHQEWNREREAWAAREEELVAQPFQYT